MNFSAVIAMVKRDRTDDVVDAAKGAGATGATIIPGRGTGSREAKSFFGLVLEEQTDVILMLLQEGMVDDVLTAVRTAGQFNKPGTGIAFAIPVQQVAGLSSQMERQEKKKS